MKIKKKWIREILRSLIIIAAVIWLVIVSSLKAKAQTEMIDLEIKTTLECAGVPPFTIKLLIAQAKFESGNYQSKLFREHCNLYGMVHPRRRNTYSKGPYARAEKRCCYASYNSVQESVQDQLLYLWYVGEKPAYKTTAQYATRLKQLHYYESPVKHYTKGLLYYANN